MKNGLAIIASKRLSCISKLHAVRLLQNLSCKHLRIMPQGFGTIGALGGSTFNMQLACRSVQRWTALSLWIPNLDFLSK